MLGSGEARKLEPENMGPMRGDVGFRTIAVVSSSLWSCLSLVQLSAAACAGLGFLCVSQRSAEDVRLGGSRLLLSHLPHGVAPPELVLLRWLDNDDYDDVRMPLDNCLFMSQRSQEEARPGLELLEHDEAGLRGFLSFLCASHLSTESARPGLVLEANEAGRMMRQGFVGGVGRRPGRSDAAALAIARSTEYIGDLS